MRDARRPAFDWSAVLIGAGIGFLTEFASLLGVMIYAGIRAYEWRWIDFASTKGYVLAVGAVYIGLSAGAAVAAVISERGSEYGSAIGVACIIVFLNMFGARASTLSLVGHVAAGACIGAVIAAFSTVSKRAVTRLRSAQDSSKEG